MFHHAKNNEDEKINKFYFDYNAYGLHDDGVPPVGTGGGHHRLQR